VTNIFNKFNIRSSEMKGWEACEEAEKHASEWYEYKMEDLHYQGLDENIGVEPATEAPPVPAQSAHKE
jgi:hypothetical protein